MRIMTNVSALTAQEASTNINKHLNSSLEKLSSGLQINKASDDGSGLAIADKLRTEASGLNQAVDNGNSAIALLQMADKAMSEQSTILDTVKQKLIQASTDTTSQEGMTAIGKDIFKLIESLNQIASKTNYNGTYLLQGDNVKADSNNVHVSTSNQLDFQMGTNANDIIALSSGIHSNSAGLEIYEILQEADENYPLQGVFDNSGGMGKRYNQDYIRDNFLSQVDNGLSKLNEWRTDIGSTQIQVESSVRNLMTQTTNIKAAESVVRDVDYAKESASFNKQNIIAQAGTYAMSQANTMQQSVSKLFQ